MLHTSAGIAMMTNSGERKVHAWHLNTAAVRLPRRTDRFWEALPQIN